MNFLGIESSCVETGVALVDDSWWAGLMAQHPQAAQFAQAEVDSILLGHPIEYADVGKLHYLNWSLKDTPLTNRSSFMPFGTVPRVCIGSHFALTEMTLIAAHLLQNFSFSSAKLPKPKFQVLLSPEGGMPLRLMRRDC